MNQIIRIILAPILGGLIGYFIGDFFQRQGGACPLTCNPWGAMLTGAIFGLFIALQK